MKDRFQVLRVISPKRERTRKFAVRIPGNLMEYSHFSFSRVSQAFPSEYLPQRGFLLLTPVS